MNELLAYIIGFCFGIFILNICMFYILATSIDTKLSEIKNLLKKLLDK